MKSAIADVVGKTISGVVVATNARSPQQQLFLTFADGSYFEIWGANFSCAGGLDRGGPAAAIAYVLKSGGSVTAKYGDAES